MKITKIPGLGSFGHFIDDIDFDHLTDEEWTEIGKLHLEGLVTILRNVKISKDQFHERIKQFGPFKGTRNSRPYFKAKYGEDFDPLADSEAFVKFNVSVEDERYMRRRKYLVEATEGGNFLTRVSGIKDSQGNDLGVFSAGELRWHSNESSELTFAPGVALLGDRHMVGSSTGYVQTADYYESISESFRSELDEMILIHKYKPGGINNKEIEDPDFGMNIKMEFCYNDGAEVPLVITSPGGHRGLHYTLNTADSIKGMTDQESARIFKAIDKELFTEKYVYDYHYEMDNVLSLFDNSITLHRRKDPGHTERLAYRIQYDFSNLLDKAWYPYHQAEYAERYKKQTHELIDLLKIENFKLP